MLEKIKNKLLLKRFLENKRGDFPYWANVLIVIVIVILIGTIVITLLPDEIAQALQDQISRLSTLWTTTR